MDKYYKFLIYYAKGTLHGARKICSSMEKINPVTLNRAFINACFYGHYNVAKWLNDSNIHFDYNRALRLACSNGHLKVAKWLYNLGGINIHINDDEAFMDACDHAHARVAKWLTTLDNNYIVVIENNKLLHFSFINPDIHYDTEDGEDESFWYYPNKFQEPVGFQRDGIV